MRLQRNVSPDGMGKFAVINLRKGTFELGTPGTPEEFFVIKLKDEFSKAALLAYAQAAEATDPEYAKDIRELAARAGADSPFCKKPD